VGSPGCTFFGEETSYLQHYIGFSTPEAYAVLNAQNELNIHNLNPLQGGLDCHGVFGQWALLK